MKTTAYLPETVTPVEFPARPCRIEGCEKPRCMWRTVCSMHDTRIKRHGDPEFTQWTVADDLTVDHAAGGRRVLPGMTRLERRLLALRLTARGVSVPEIARVLEVTERTVYRWRNATPRPASARPATHPTARKAS